MNEPRASQPVTRGQEADEALDVERTAENLTRWMMGEGLVKVNRWMTVGWRESMFDEGVALWSAALREFAALRGQEADELNPALSCGYDGPGDCSLHHVARTPEGDRLRETLREAAERALDADPLGPLTVEPSMSVDPRDLLGALRGQVREPLDVEALRQAIYTVSVRHDWAHTTDTEDRTEEIAAEYLQGLSGGEG